MLEHTVAPTVRTFPTRQLPLFYRGSTALIYSPSYDIQLEALKVGLPFDLGKRGKVSARLQEWFELSPTALVQPEPVYDDELQTVHSAPYLRSLRTSLGVAQAFGIPRLAELPYHLLDTQLLYPLRTAVGGTKVGVALAEQRGWAINLSGGFHHAAPDKGSGFCVFNDILVGAAQHLAGAGRRSVLVVDLDAHQGNGVARGFAHSPNCHLLDVFNGDIFPRDHEAEQLTRYAVPLSGQVSDQEYMLHLEHTLARALTETLPTLLIYVAGADVALGDPLGKMALHRSTVIARDLLVTGTATRLGIPWLMVLGGGYGPQAHAVIADGIGAILGQLSRG